MTALAGLLGAGAGLGLMLIVAGWHGTTLPRPRPTGRVLARVERANLRLALAAGLAVLAGAATGWPVGAALAALAGWGAPSLLGGTRARTAALARVEAVAGWAEMLRDTLAGAAGLEQAIIATAPLASPPIRPQVTALAARLGGERLTPALRAFAEEVADPTCDLVVAALVLAAEHQAHRLAELLGSLAHTAREQASMRLRVEAGRARTRTSVKVILGVTLAFVFGLAVLNRGYLAPYDTPVGQLVLLLVGVMFTVAFAWLTGISRPAPASRILTNPAGSAGPARVGRP